MTAPTTVAKLVSAGRDASPAVEAPDRDPLTYAALRAQIRGAVAALNDFGIGRGDRVALVLPNGPEMATAFLGVAAGAVAAPLNPAYRAEDFAFYLTDLRAKALIVEAKDNSPAIEVAHELGVAVIELRQGTQAGVFKLVGQGKGGAARPGLAWPDDLALILHTSGTTSRPKIVPLTHRNITASAQAIAATLDLTADDRGLNIMPLFHIHGLIAGLLAPLSQGGAVICTPGFNALRFFAQMRQSQPTWFTAVPTMHQTILTRAAQNRAVIDETPLRFLRSSSASMPPRVIGELEATFGAPLIEAYGMTEAAHQMTSNPLYGARKPGAVGPSAGPDVAIMGEDGALLKRGEIGEVVIRGDSVFSGYENNDKANAEAFHNDWFRTGDQGVLDGDGYLSLTSRLKEIINRGGEKISPREVDEALMDHPAVAQVVCFGLPHDKLGEEVAAAVVLRDGAQASEADLRAFAGQKLAAFKVPRRVVFVTEIPKGATGKLQRIGLAEKLGVRG